MYTRSLVFVTVFISSCLVAQTKEERNELHIKSAVDFEVTGNGGAETWKTTYWFELSKAGGPLPHTTRAKMLYSDKGIYTLFYCEDKKISSTFKQDFANLWLED